MVGNGISFGGFGVLVISKSRQKKRPTLNN